MGRPHCSLLSLDEMNTNYHGIISAALVLACSGSAQVASVAPKGHWSGTPIELVTVTRVEVSHNTPAAIRQELLDTNTIGLIGASTGLTLNELATLAVASGPVEEELWFYQAKGSQKAGKRFGEKLHSYVQGRLGGHTKGFVLSTLTNGSPVQTADPELRALLNQRPELPADLLERSGSGLYTNQLEEVFRTAQYCLADGEVAWCYDFRLTRDGAAFAISESKVDAQERDPKLSTVFKSVDAAVSAEMREKGMSGRLGSVHSFWLMKKEKLQAKGIKWRSPAELSPGVIFD